MLADELNRPADGPTDTSTADHAPFHVNGDIVVGVDGSPESVAALRWALTEAGLSGQTVNAVFGWTASWDMGSKPDNDDNWEIIRKRITDRLRQWVDDAYKSLSNRPQEVVLTSVQASGTAALLQIGANAQQIVVGRRSMGRVMHWLSGSTSMALTKESPVPVTIVHAHEPDEGDVRTGIANALTSDPALHASDAAPSSETETSDIVVGVDGSPASSRVLRFAAHEAALHHQPLHVIFCWQVKELGEIPGYEHAVAPMNVNQDRAEQLVKDIVARASLDPQITVLTHAFHITAAKGLLQTSRYADHIIIGSRGLTGLDAHFLGSVSSQLVDLAECTITVVR